MVPFTDKTAAPWFAAYGQTVTDPRTWRHMRENVQKERDELAGLLPAYERAGFADVVADVKAGITRSDDLLAKMAARWAEIVA